MGGRVREASSLPPKVEVRGSPAKLAGLVLAAVGMTAASSLLAFRVLTGIAAGSFGQFVGYVGLIFFGFCTLVLSWRLWTSQGVVVTMDAQGILDKRVSQDTIPWNAIRAISTWELSGQKIMVLAVDPDAERRLNLTPIARATRQANASLGADGLCVTALGLSLGYEELLLTATAYWKRDG